MADDDRRSIAVIDGNSLMHRAFHAIGSEMNAPDGRPTNAVFGFLSMFIKLVEDFHPWGIVCCFDKGKPKVRMDMLPQYKAQRPPMDPSLHEQFPMVKDLLCAMEVPVVELEGWEGDDLLGTLAREGSDAGFDMLLITGDRDMYQLSTDHVRIVSTRKGMSDVSIMTPESVADLYGGITPELVPDFYGLKGDSSDNIPGVPGIGPKKAAALIEKYGDLDGVIAHADEVKGKMGENLRAHIDDALLSRKVATILTDAPVEVDLESSEFPTFDEAVVAEAFSKLGFTAMTRRMLALEDSAEVPAQDFKLPEPVEGSAAEEALAAACEAGVWLGVAMEKVEAKDLFDTGAEVLWVATPDKLLRFQEDAQDRLVELLAVHRVAAVDVKGLIHRVYPMDSADGAALDIHDVSAERIFDCGVAAYLLDSTVGSYDAAYLAQEFLNLTLPQAAGSKGAPADAPAAEPMDALVAAACVEPLAQAMEARGARECFSLIEMPLVPVLAQMERTGMHADASVFEEQSRELGRALEELQGRIYAEAGEPFKLSSPQQLSHVLFDVLGLPTAGLKRTRTGYFSTNAKVLEELAQDHAIVRDVIEYREKSKIKATYLDALPSMIARDGRIHTTLNQTVTATGRISSSDPNLQNIPVRSDLGRQVRLAFTVPEDSVFLACDYSQIELRLLAHLSGDEHLIAAFRSGEDFHAATAARVFGVDPSEVTGELRSRAKAVNFGIVYGQQAYGLSQSLRIPQKEAQAMIDAYYAAYPGVRRYLDQVMADAKRDGYATTMYGRRRPVPDIRSSNFSRRSAAERTAINHPMQGSAADIIKIAMARVEAELAREDLKSLLILQIHDELDLQVPKDELERVSELVKRTMEGVVELEVPLVADVSWGHTWADAK